jgi:uncharacterized membrane protein YfcA
MSALIVVAVCAFLTALLTLYSGFGLGTLLLPVFALFFPVETAVAATAVVHGANNVFKMAAAGRHADKALVLGFGLPAVLAAFAGAALLGQAAGLPELARYTVLGKEAVVTPVKLVMAVLMAFFALFELLPGLRELRVPRRHLVTGGLLSGFFGGLSGHQGALRATFLTKTGVSTEVFVGTNAAIGFLVDMARLLVYALTFGFTEAGARVPEGAWGLVATGVVGAFLGVVTGRRRLKSVTMKTVQGITGVMLLGIALVLGLGLL